MHNSFNRILCILFSVLLLVALAAPVFAAETIVTLDNLPSAPPSHDEAYNHAIIQYTKNKDGAFYYAFPRWEYTDSSNNYFTAHDVLMYRYYLGDDGWEYYKTNVTLALNVIDYRDSFLWTNFDITTPDGGTVIFEGSSYPVPMCDGTSCPATDANHDNICDDCGNVLAFSLRSTLLDYAISTAESYGSGYPYYAVFSHSDADSYNLYISKAPMTATPPNYDTATGDSMQYTVVFTNTDGSFDRSTFGSSTSASGTLVYANHTIENFLEPPLAAVIQGVTGEAMKVEIPNLMKETRTIVLCGVGCLALLIVLALFSKRLFPYLKG